MNDQQHDCYESGALQQAVGQGLALGGGLAEVYRLDHDPGDEQRRQNQAGDAGFWKLHDWLYAPEADLSDAGLTRAAAKLSLDPSVAQAARTSRYDAAINADMAAGDAAAIEGTPASFINDYYAVGALTEAEYAIVIERALRESAGG